MAPTTVDQIGNGDSTSGESHRSIPTPFLKKTYQLVDDSDNDDIISWSDDGNSFVVWKPAEFARDILPKYFKHNNFSSFVRQLNTYGFRKVIPDRWEFSNDCFVKGEEQLLRDIQRRRMTPATVTVAVPTAARILSPSRSNSEEQVLSSNSSPAATTAIPMTNPCLETNSTAKSELIDENERLRRENQQLSNELAQMRSLCSNIYLMTSSYGSGSGIPIAKPLELMLMQSRFTCEETAVADKSTSCPRLGSKRGRDDGVCLSLLNSDDHFLQLQQPGSGPADVKSEPLDQQPVQYFNLNQCRRSDHQRV